MRRPDTSRSLLIASNLWYFSDGMLGPLFAVFAQRIGGDILDISWAWATFLLVTGILVLLSGRISDHRNKEHMLIAGYALNCLFTFGYLLVTTPYQLFAIQAGLGFSLALSWPTWDALYGSHQLKKKDGYGWGLADGEAYIGTGVAILIGGAIVTTLSFDALFIAMGSVQALATLYLFKKLW